MLRLAAKRNLHLKPILSVVQSRSMMTAIRMAQLNASRSLVMTQTRNVHARGYNDFYDMEYWIFHEVNAALQSCHNVPNYAFVFEKYSKYLTDFQIAYAFEDIAIDNLERTPEFWNVILPRVKQQVPTLDRQCTQALSKIISAAGHMQLQDNELWEALESKLVDEGLLRYFTLKETAEILIYFGHCGRGSDELIEQIEKTFIKHRKALQVDPNVLRLCKQGFQSINKGSEILKRVLADPTTTLPQLE